MSEQPGEEREAGLAAGAAAFGRWLLQERELRGLAREEVVRLSRLAPAVVDALESGDPDRMPPKAYVFGYLRTYAGIVGLDADDVVLRWQEVVGPEVTSVGSPRRRRPRNAVALLGMVLAVAALVALAVALFAPRRQRAPLQLRKPPSAERAPYTQEAPPPSSPR
jgi:cytoskeletal protein RodZ